MVTPTATSLPRPDDIAVQHSQQLLGVLHKQLDAGAMSFAQYMQTVLYEPGLGYYMAGAQKFGSRGDFITAPEVSDLFGQCIAAQCREVLDLIGGSILELGAGSGRLALSVLSSLSDAPPEQYCILEPSAELALRQKQLLQQHLPETLFARVTWLDALPENFVGVCLANEVMDALPVELFTRQGDQIHQVCIDLSNGGQSKNLNDDLTGDICSNAFKYVTQAAPESLQNLVAAIEAELGTPFESGYQSEVCTLLAPWVSSLGKAIKKGVLLLSDYGYPRQEYYLPERRSGTLACYYQHHFHDNVFYYPGLQDITAHVDFTRVVEAGSAAGFALLGYTSQTGFLLNTGISTLAAKNIAACKTELEQLSLAKEIKTLTLPGEMGERFQFMALGKNLTSALHGFAAQDLSHRL